MLAIFLDQETTGLDPEVHRTIEIAFKIVNVLTNEVLASYHAVVFLPQETWEKRDPSSVKINGFTWEKIHTGKSPDVIRKEMQALFSTWNIVRGKSVFICQNPSFDRAFFNHLIPVNEQEKLKLPYHWLDLASMYYLLRVNNFHKKKDSFPSDEGLSKDAIAHYFHLPPEDKPHLAMNGVDHLIECYKRVVLAMADELS